MPSHTFTMHHLSALSRFTNISATLLVIALTACSPTTIPTPTTVPPTVAPTNMVTPSKPPLPTNTPAPTDTATPKPTNTRIPSLPPEATQLGGAGYIFFSSKRDGNYQLYRMRPDGSHQERLTENEVSDVDPSVSPDGKLIIYVRFDLKASPPFSEYRWMTASEDGVFGRPAIDTVTWSPDGKFVALTTVTQDGKFDIYRLRVDGTEVLRLTDWPDDDKDPAWSPDGETIAFTRSMLRQGYVYLMNANDGSNARRLVQEIPSWEPAWSPDGSQIAFWSGDDISTQIYVIDADGKNLRQLTEGKGYHENPEWSPDGAWIAFWSDETGDREIYAIRPDGSTMINLTNSPGEDENPWWSK